MKSRKRAILSRSRFFHHLVIRVLAGAGLLVALHPAAQQALAVEADFELSLESRLFAHEGLAGQDNQSHSLGARGEFVFETGEQSQVVFAPFVRVDSEDNKRTHADIREFFWSTLGERWEFSLGVKQVFWGVAEFNHLVDVINQTDLVENVDGEDKLGQPMAQLTLLRDFGTLDLFVMSGFRERTFPGRDGRFRLPAVVDTGAARYEADSKAAHVDFAARWSRQFDALDIGIYHFNGTGRAPDLVPEPRPLDQDGSQVELVPVYVLIDQTGLDAQYQAGNWAFKLESIRRSGQGKHFVAATAGTEYTMVGVLGSQMDLGLVAEYFYDERDELAFDTLFEHDYAIGLRLGLNDASNTQALIGVIRDQETAETVVSVEASRQLGDHFAITVEGRVFAGSEGFETGSPAALPAEEERAAYLAKEDYLQVELKWFF